jgi:hypothetical protein
MSLDFFRAPGEQKTILIFPFHHRDEHGGFPYIAVRKLFRFQRGQAASDTIFGFHSIHLQTCWI